MNTEGHAHITTFGLEVVDGEKTRMIHVDQWLDLDTGVAHIVVFGESVFSAESRCHIFTPEPSGHIEMRYGENNMNKLQYIRDGAIVLSEEYRENDYDQYFKFEVLIFKHLVSDGTIKIPKKDK